MLKTQLAVIEKPKKIRTSICDFYVKDGKVFLENGMIIENDLEFFKQEIKIFKRNLKRTKLSSDKFYFLPTENDWNIIKKNVFWINLIITNKCNSNCKICVIGEDECEEMTKKDLRYILSKIGKNKAVVFFGKEPTMHEELFEMIDLVRKSGNYSELFTNGLRLANPEYTKELKERKIERVLFSFDGFQEEIYEKLKGDRSQLYTKLKALHNLKKYEINTILSFTLVDGINEHQLPLILKFAMKNKFIKGILIKGATPYGRFDVNMRRYLTKSDIIKLLEKVSDGKIKMEYFLEFRKLKYNIRYFMNKVGLSFPTSFIFNMNTLYKIETCSEPQIKEFIPLSELRDINKAIENFKFFSIIKCAIKYALKYGLKFFNLVKAFYSTFKGNTLWIDVGNVSVPLNHLPVTYSSLTIEKIGGKPIVNALT